MDWIRDLFPTAGNNAENTPLQRDERFPRHTYGLGYPIVVRRQELSELERLLEIERETPDGWDNFPLLSREDFDEIVEDAMGDIGEDIPSLEERGDEIQGILDTWQEQITGSEDAVWATTGVEYRLKFYITRCESRAEAEGDEFQEPPELETARDILNRIQSAQETEVKLAVVHKQDLPLETPKETFENTD